MSLRFVLLISWSLPLGLLAAILYHEYATEAAPIVETNSKMRIKMCREHIDSAKQDPADNVARKAIEDCTTAGYLTRKEVELALD